MQNKTVLNLPASEDVPIRIDESGAVRISNTRVTLHTVIASFKQGATAETIIEQYPALNLSDVYLVIGYYLRHKSEVDAYMDDYEAEGKRIRAEHQADQVGLRERLLKRLANSDVSVRR